MSMIGPMIGLSHRKPMSCRDDARHACTSVQTGA